MASITGNENKDRIRLWAEALESGLYDQSDSCLRTSTDMDAGYSYCCLGVAVEVALANGYERQNSYKVLADFTTAVELESYDTESHFLWDGVRDWYGFDAHDPLVVHRSHPDGDLGDDFRLATEANDDLALTFVEIAAGLRNLYLTEPAA